MVDKDGLAERPGEPGRAAGVLSEREFKDEYVDPIIADLNRHIASGDGKKRVVLFIHGGLNGRQAGLHRAEEYFCFKQVFESGGDRAREHPGCEDVLARFAGDAGLDSANALRAALRPLTRVRDTRFVFINWDSSLWGSVRDDLCCIRAGVNDPWLGMVGMPFVTASRLGAAAFLMPLSIGYQLRTLGDGALQSDGGADGPHCLGDLGGEETPLTTRLRLSAQRARYDARRVATYALFFVPRWLSVPLIQGFGTSAWDVMKRRAELAMGDLYDLAPEKRVGGVRTLMRRIREEAQRWPAGGVELVLFGHSMGAIVANRILMAFPDLRFDHIVYAGAAAGIDDVRAALHPYLAAKGNERTTFWNFSLSEANESGEIDGPDVYERGSLLVWIDNLFERGNTVARRTFGRASNLRRFYSRPEDETIARRIHLVEFVGVDESGGLAASPSVHGQFDEPGVVDRVLKLVADGRCPRGQPIR